MASRDFRRPGWGSDSIFAMNRWFAPPANFHDAFGVRYPRPLVEKRVGVLLPIKPLKHQLPLRPFRCAAAALSFMLRTAEPPHLEWNQTVCRRSKNAPDTRQDPQDSVFVGRTLCLYLKPPSHRRNQNRI
jgi:hypothetical protein